MASHTQIIPVDRDDPSVEALEEAAGILRDGGLVAFATETVYGLGADATNPEAVARIFEVKGRPARNPLIVHADRIDMARSCVAAWPPSARRLADRFWPGPLTLVLPRSALVPDIVTARRETVGVRVPLPTVARRLIQLTGRPIAAPSANRSTRVSPTLARHVEHDLDGRIDLILDSGPTSLGLESTVLDLSTSRPRLLRPGMIAIEELAIILGDVRPVDEPGEEISESPASPGQMAVHYAPRARAVRVEASQLERFLWPDRAALIIVGPHERPAIPDSVDRVELPSPDLAARMLYATLHDCDERGVSLIVIVPPPDQPRWRAIRDRIWRATQPL